MYIIINQTVIVIIFYHTFVHLGIKFSLVKFDSELVFLLTWWVNCCKPVCESCIKLLQCILFSSITVPSIHAHTGLIVFIVVVIAAPVCGHSWEETHLSHLYMWFNPLHHFLQLMNSGGGQDQNCVVNRASACCHCADPPVNYSLNPSPYL